MKWLFPFLFPLLLHAQLGLRDPAYIATSASGTAFPPSGSDLLFWGRVDDLALADDARVSSWTDLSGNGNHAVQSTGSSQPTNKTSIINGHSVLRFRSTHMLWPSNMISAATNAEILMVGKSFADPSAAGNYTIWSFPRTTGVGDSSHPFTTFSVIQEAFGSSAASPLRAAPSTASNAHVYSVSVQTNKMLQLWNGRMFNGWDKLITGFTNNINPTVGLGVAGATDWSGDIAEVLIYKRVLSTNDRQTIYTYLSSRYNIACESVSTVFTPTSFTLNGSGVKAWWKADSLVLNNNDPVSTWTDSGGGGNTLTGTLLLRPLYKSALYNGLPAVRFDGVNDQLLCTAFNLTNFTVCVVAKVTGSNNCVIGNQAANFQTRLAYNNTVAMQFYDNGTDINSGTGYQWPNGALLFYAFRRTNAVMTFVQNGVEQSAVSGGTTVFPVDTVGNTLAAAALPFNGDMCELILYNYALTSDELIQLYYGYLRDRWGLP